MTNELRKIAKENPSQFYIEWIKRDPNSLAMARIMVSFEDTKRVLQRVKSGKQSTEEGASAKKKHSELLSRMLSKKWVNRAQIKSYIIY